MAKKKTGIEITTASDLLLPLALKLDSSSCTLIVPAALVRHWTPDDQVFYLCPCFVILRDMVRQRLRSLNSTNLHVQSPNELSLAR